MENSFPRQIKYTGKKDTRSAGDRYFSTTTLSVISLNIYRYKIEEANNFTKLI